MPWCQEGSPAPWGPATACHLQGPSPRDPRVAVLALLPDCEGSPGSPPWCRKQKFLLPPSARTSGLLAENEQISKECAHPLSPGRGRVALGRLLRSSSKALSENLSSGLGKGLQERGGSLKRSYPGTGLCIPTWSQQEGHVPAKKLPGGV